MTKLIWLGTIAVLTIVISAVIYLARRPTPHETLWKVWFAWHPVLLEDGRRVWLRRVQRRWFTDVLWYREIPDMSEY